MDWSPTEFQVLRGGSGVFRIAHSACRMRRSFVPESWRMREKQLEPGCWRMLTLIVQDRDDES